MTDQNPIQVAVDAIVNCGPREDSTRIGSAGTVRRQAVDVSPLRRVNQAIALLTIGAREAAFRNVKSVAECLAEELINAAKGSSNSYAIKKKDELEKANILAALEVPVLTIVGSEDVFTAPGIGEFAAATATRGRVVRFEGCGHGPMFEEYDRYCAELLGFLTGLE